MTRERERGGESREREWGQRRGRERRREDHRTWKEDHQDGT